jgi:hypothetical protein
MKKNYSINKRGRILLGPYTTPFADPTNKIGGISDK